MAEEYSLGENEDHINVEESDDILDNIVIGKESDPVVKDDVETVKSYYKGINEKKRKLEEKLTEDTDKMSNELKDIAKKEKRKELIKKIALPFLPETWIKFIQYWDDLLFVILVDLSIVGLLFSLLSAIYIIISLDSENLLIHSGKFAGCVILFVLSIVVQINVNQDKGKIK